MMFLHKVEAAQTWTPAKELILAVKHWVKWEDEERTAKDFAEQRQSTWGVIWEIKRPASNVLLNMDIFLQTFLPNSESLEEEIILKQVTLNVKNIHSIVHAEGSTQDEYNVKILPDELKKLQV